MAAAKIKEIMKLGSRGSAQATQGTEKGGDSGRSGSQTRLVKFFSRGGDFWLYLIVIVLLNVVGITAYLRFDLTANGAYSLSPVSVRTVRHIRDPLSIKVFFSSDLPAPYNSVDRYVRDLLAEYGNAARGSGFSYEFFDMEKEENKEIAESYGVYSVQVREIKNDEFQSRNAFMGLAITYGDLIEKIQQITSAEGLEYRITTTISKMVDKVDALTGLPEPISVTLYASSRLQEFEIAGLGDMERQVRDVFKEVNDENYGRLEFESVDPSSSSEIDELVRRFGLRRITWRRNADGPRDAQETGQAVLGIVLQSGDEFRLVPLNLSRQIFGGYQVTGLSNLKESISEAIDGLVSQHPAIGYATGYGIRDLNDDREGAGLLKRLGSDMYTFQEIDLESGVIPEDVGTVIINGPAEALSEQALFAVDQFLMRGGSVLAFVDSFREIVPDQQAQFSGQGPVYIPLNTGLTEMLEHYGVRVGKNYVLDANCYVANQPGYGDLNLYYVPVLEKDELNQDHPITRNLAKLIFMKSSALTVDESVLGEDTTFAALASSSEASWLAQGQINLSPLAMRPPPEEEMESFDLAVAVEGTFTSYFDAPPAPVDESEETDGAEDGAATVQGGDGELTTEGHVEESLKPGRLVVIGTSEMTGAQLLDAEGRSTNAIFVHNVIDYLAGNIEVARMRSKGLSFNPLRETTEEFRAGIKAINIAGLPVLVILVGLAAWRARINRRRRIAAAFGIGEIR